MILADRIYQTESPQGTFNLIPVVRRRYVNETLEIDRDEYFILDKQSFHKWKRDFINFLKKKQVPLEKRSELINQLSLVRNNRWFGCQIDADSPLIGAEPPFNAWVIGGDKFYGSDHGGPVINIFDIDAKEIHPFYRAISNN